MFNNRCELVCRFILEYRVTPLAIMQCHPKKHIWCSTCSDISNVLYCPEMEPMPQYKQPSNTQHLWPCRPSWADNHYDLEEGGGGGGASEKCITYTLMKIMTDMDGHSQFYSPKTLVYGSLFNFIPLFSQIKVLSIFIYLNSIPILPFYSKHILLSWLSVNWSDKSSILKHKVWMRTKRYQ